LQCSKIYIFCLVISIILHAENCDTAEVNIMNIIHNMIIAPCLHCHARACTHANTHTQLCSPLFQLYHTVTQIFHRITDNESTSFYISAYSWYFENQLAPFKFLAAHYFHVCTTFITKHINILDMHNCKYYVRIFQYVICITVAVAKGTSCRDYYSMLVRSCVTRYGWVSFQQFFGKFYTRNKTNILSIQVPLHYKTCTVTSAECDVQGN
jgi:hypothetical protein